MKKEKRKRIILILIIASLVLLLASGFVFSGVNFWEGFQEAFESL